MRKTGCAAALAGALTLANAAFGAAGDVDAQLAPEQSLGTALDGSSVTVASFAGRPVVVLFWASWCAACAKEMRMAEALHRKFGDRFTVLAISIDPQENLKSFLRKNRMLTLEITRDAHRALAREFAVQGVPMSLVIDHAGVVRWRRVGFDDGWLQELAQPLAAAVNAATQAAARRAGAETPAPPLETAATP